MYFGNYADRGHYRCHSGGCSFRPANCLRAGLEPRKLPVDTESVGDNTECYFRDK
jgi:hypothetical protein